MFLRKTVCPGQLALITVGVAVRATHRVHILCTGEPTVATNSGMKLRYAVKREASHHAVKKEASYHAVKRQASHHPFSENSTSPELFYRINKIGDF